MAPLAADSISVSALSLYAFLFAIVILMPFLIRERQRGGRPKEVVTAKTRPSAATAYLLRTRGTTIDRSTVCLHTNSI